MVGVGVVAALPVVVIDDEHALIVVDVVIVDEWVVVDALIVDVVVHVVEARHGVEVDD